MGRKNYRKIYTCCNKAGLNFWQVTPTEIAPFMQIQIFCKHVAKFELNPLQRWDDLQLDPGIRSYADTPANQFMNYSISIKNPNFLK